MKPSSNKYRPFSLPALLVCGIVAFATLAASGTAQAAKMRVWIDTDAACGAGEKVDPDDCLAILILLRAPEVEVVGISTVFGNAPLATTDRIARALVRVLGSERTTPPPVHRGAALPLDKTGATPSRSPAVAALRAALAEGPLTIVALGPLTNIAAALKDRPKLRANVKRIVAVMGKRAGHIFHPAEGKSNGALFGHGPIFRDFNLCQDIKSATTMLPMGLPVTLVPYEAARQVSLTRADLDRIEAAGGAGKWVASRSRAWLAFWRKSMGRDGFYPFDALAAAYVIAPEHFLCANEPARIAKDRKTYGIVGGPDALIVGGPSRARLASTRFVGRMGYCTRISPRLHAWLVKRLTAPKRR